MKTAFLIIFVLALPCYAQEAAPSQTPIGVIELRGSKSTGDASTFAAACKLAGVPDSVAPEKVSYVKFSRLANGTVSVTVKYQNAIPSHVRSGTSRTRRFTWKKLLPGFITNG